MQLSKRDGSPYWWVSFTDSDGRRHRVSTKQKDKREATRAASAIVVDQATHVPKGSAVTLYAALSAYQSHLALHGKVSAEHVAIQRDKTCGLLASSAGRFRLDPELPFHELSEVDLQSIIEARVKEGNGPTTVAHELKNIRAAARYADGLNRRIPAIKNWRIPKLVQKTRWMTDDEWQLVYNYLSPDRIVTQSPSNRKTFVISLGDRAKRQMQDAQDLMVCLTMCGGRWSEVARLSRDKVDLEANTIMIWGNKTQKYRMAPLPALLKEVLARRIAALSVDQKLIFANDLGEVRGQSSRAITRAIAACGLNTPETIKSMGRCTVHSLRHTFASWLIQKGAGLADVQRALGHTTLQMTLRYAHLSETESSSRLTTILSGR